MEQTLNKTKKKTITQTHTKGLLNVYIFVLNKGKKQTDNEQASRAYTEK